MDNISESSIYNLQAIFNDVLKVNPKLQANKIFKKGQSDGQRKIRDKSTLVKKEQRSIFPLSKSDSKTVEI